MRQNVLDYIKKLGIRGYSVSTELPYDENDTPLYIKNPKKIYVSDTSIVTEPFISIMGGSGIYNETTTINIYFAADAKTAPATFADTVSKLRTVADIQDLGWFQSRLSEVETTYENDLAVTTVAVRLTRLT